MEQNRINLDKIIYYIQNLEGEILIVVSKMCISLNCEVNLYKTSYVNFDLFKYFKPCKCQPEEFVFAEFQVIFS